VGASAERSAKLAPGPLSVTTRPPVPTTPRTSVAALVPSQFSEALTGLVRLTVRIAVAQLSRRLPQMLSPSATTSPLRLTSKKGV
jgi:hypothetical protein